MGRHTFLAVAAIVVATSIAPPAASAGVRLARADGKAVPQRYQRWVDSAAIPAPDRTVTLHIAPCPGGPAWAGGCAMPQVDVVYMLPHAAGPHVLFHELGHVFDAAELSLDRRRGFQRIVGRPGAWHGAAASDPPVEQFAEAYSLCARRVTIGEREFAMYGYSPTPRMHRRVCALIARASGAGRARGH
jgi:hypothetical protein